jgi:hypothetical protein
MIRAFIDGLLQSFEPSNEVIIQCGIRIHDLGKDGRLRFHTTASEDNANIIVFLLDSLEETEQTNTLVKLLLTQNYVRHTACHMAAEKVETEILHKLWERAKEVLTQEELNNMFLTRDGYKRTAWHMASGKVQI